MKPRLRRSPGGASGASWNALGNAPTVTETADVVVDGAPAVVVFDHRFLAGYEAGYAHGIDRGRQLADDEAQWPMRLAEQHVRRLADIEPHEVRWQRAVGARTSCGDVVDVKAQDRPDGTIFQRAVGA